MHSSYVFSNGTFPAAWPHNTTEFNPVDVDTGFAPCSDSTKYFKFATANVCTLLDGKFQCSYFQAGRRQFVEMQFDSACVDVVEIQEARDQGDVIRHGLAYEQFCSSADVAGCYGCQIWIRRSLGWEVETFEPVSPRICVVKIKTKLQCAVAFLSAHAPHMYATAHAKCVFWDQFRQGAR